jgi:SAM-dependent methyltransferase
VSVGEKRPKLTAEPGLATAMRRTMFLSQDGVVLCMTLRGLDELGILEPSLGADRSLAELHPDLTPSGFGSLRVAARSLAGVGWVTDHGSLDPGAATLRWTDAGRLAAANFGLYVSLGEFLAGFASLGRDAWSAPWAADRCKLFLEFVARAEEGWQLGGLPRELGSQIRGHLDGALIVPTMLWLHEGERLGADCPVLGEGDAEQGMTRLLETLAWVEKPGGAWTPSGRHARRFALNFGGVATYLPMLARLPQLYRGEATVPVDPGYAGEWHVNRELNLRISAAAHRRYFADTDAIFLELFNREPIADQPRFIADTGCGDGSWLVHLQRLISERTLRGAHLVAEPLQMVGVDLSRQALEHARRNLEAAGVPALLIPGDVTDPDQLRAALSQHGLRIEDGLHIRAFIDHERAYRGSEAATPVPGWSTGAYLDARGEPLSGEAVERDMVAHFRRWGRHVGKHGMVVLEAHCVAPEVSARHAGVLQSVSLDAHQAYSKQYPVDHPAFIQSCHQAGLQTPGHCERRYPARRPFVAVSLNRLVASGAGTPLPAIDRGAPRSDTWQPAGDVDLEDGRALHEILFSGGDLRYPAMWCSAPTGFVVAGALAVIESRLQATGEAEVIRILDYGAGTGTATIELLKACRERGIERRLLDRGASLEVHMVDLPTSWFAQAFTLLSGCAWTRFHSLQAPEGGFKPLVEITGGQAMDVVMANMVFHLIPPRALERAAAELAAVLQPGGRLVWSAPDLGPPGADSVLLHDPNRALRKRWLEILQGSNGASAPSPRVAEAAALAGQNLDADGMRAAQERADRRILPGPLADAACAALGTHFLGEPEFATYEMLSEDIVRGLLVPSNQAEYLPELSDRRRREEVIRDLMELVIIPALQRTGAGTALGLNFHWTLGAFSRRR